MAFCICHRGPPFPHIRMSCLTLDHLHDGKQRFNSEATRLTNKEQKFVWNVAKGVTRVGPSGTEASGPHPLRSSEGAGFGMFDEAPA